MPPDYTNPPPTAEQIAAAYAAMAAAQQADYQTNYAPWVVQDIPMPDGSQLTADALAAQSQTDLLALSTNIYNDSLLQQVAVSNFLQSATNIASSWTDQNGNTVIIDGLDALGAPMAKSPFNLESAQTVSAQKLWPGGGSGFNIAGSNVLMAEWDVGDVLTNHQEFWLGGYRVSLLDGPTASGLSDHSTHVAGTLAAWGGVAVAQGFANRGKLLESFCGYGRDFNEMPALAATNNVRVSNHSYGYLGGWQQRLTFGTNAWWWTGDDSISTNQDWHFGFYDSYAMTNDQIIYTAQTYLPVFSAGNERGPGPYQPPTQPIPHFEYWTIGGVLYWYYNNLIRPLNDAQGGFNNLDSYALSKNALIVAADNGNTNGYTGPSSVVMSTFSSWGPTADGRIKPDITAAGVNILSSVAGATNAYNSFSGTSMAAPAVTGTIGLLGGLYSQLYGTNYPPMLSSTLGGIVIHTADQAGTNTGPNYMFGWGQLNALSAANLISNNFASGSLAFTKEPRLVSGDYIQFPVVLTNNQSFKATVR